MAIRTENQRNESQRNESQRVADRLAAVARRAPGLVAIVLMALAGTGIAIYLTVEHYARQNPFCTTVGPINCASVLKSPYSLVPLTGVPVTVPGMLWFVVSGTLAAVGLARLWRGATELRRLRTLQLAWSAVGLAFVLYLVYAELVQLHAICEWCTGVHLLTLATFLVALNRWQSAHTPVPRRTGRAAGTTGGEERQPRQRPRTHNARQVALPARARRAAGVGQRGSGATPRSGG
ncbi:MAG: vitamin K epoxide reductase family protein [Ktedonobacterales bacterium]